MEEAEHSSEIAMRTSLSRAYYALYHLGSEITGASDHGTIRNRLRAIDHEVGDLYGYFQDRRSKADYMPLLSIFEPKGMKRFRETHLEDMIRVRDLFERLKEMM